MDLGDVSKSDLEQHGLIALCNEREAGQVLVDLPLALNLERAQNSDQIS